MKRGRKSRKEVVNLQTLREELYIKHSGKIHPAIRKNLAIDGVLDAVCHRLVDLEFQDRRLHFPSSGPSDFTRIYDYWTDSYIHVRYKGKDYRSDAKEC